MSEKIIFLAPQLDLDQISTFKILPRTQGFYNLTGSALLFVGMAMIFMGANSNYEYKKCEFDFSIFLQIQGTVCVLLATTTPLLHVLFHCSEKITLSMYDGYGRKILSFYPLLARIIRNIAIVLLFLEIVAYFVLLIFVGIVIVISKLFVIFKSNHIIFTNYFQII